MKPQLLHSDELNKNADRIILFSNNSKTFLENLSSEFNELVQKEIKRGNKLIHISRPKMDLILVDLSNDIRENADPEDFRIAGSDAMILVKKLKIDELSIESHIDPSVSMIPFVEGLLLSAYSFDKYFTKDKKSNSPSTVLADSSVMNEEECIELNALVNSVFSTRDLVNEPLSFLNAEKFSEEIERLGKESGFSVEVLGKAKIKSLKMGGLLSINAGSVDPPTFNIMEWKPENAVNSKPMVLVGKGVVYDTGGLSLKPTANSMDKMKCDMAGGAAVVGIMCAVSKNSLPVHIIGLVPATDNRPGGNAIVPGDVVRMHNSMTVEVLNTDAEGRMILADALSYAKKYDPELVLDMATLTGSAARAIGSYGCVAMGNADPEDMDILERSGYETYERIVKFPFWKEYGKDLKSDIADIKNIGTAEGGAISAGKFLENFTNYPYIHLDIAGPAYISAASAYRPKNGTGTGVRLVYQFIKNRFKL